MIISRLQITVGGHTLTATITDNEGKSKSVAVTLSSSLPPYDNSTVNEYKDIYHGGFGGPSKLDYSFAAKSGGNLAHYPAGASFSYTLNGVATADPRFSVTANRVNSDTKNHSFTLKVTDIWGQSWTKEFRLSVTNYPMGSGGGVLPPEIDDSVIY